MKKIFSNKKVMGTLAAVMAVALLLGGTFAWRDISQNAQNVFKASSYEAELVDIFTPPSNWEKDESINKDVYVKNTGSGDIFVRVNFDDILKLAGASEQAQNPYTAFTVNGDGTADTTSFSKFEWAMGNGLIYDIADWNGCTDAWYLDATTGWFYWGNVLTSATQTDKLLDAVKLLTDVDKDFEYIINVNMHAFSADQKGIEDLEDTDGGSANVPDEVKDMVNGIISNNDKAVQKKADDARKAAEEIQAKIDAGDYDSDASAKTAAEKAVEDYNKAADKYEEALTKTGDDKKAVLEEADNLAAIARNNALIAEATIDRANVSLPGNASFEKNILGQYTNFINYLTKANEIRETNPTNAMEIALITAYEDNADTTKIYCNKYLENFYEYNSNVGTDWSLEDLKDFRAVSTNMNKSYLEMLIAQTNVNNSYSDTEKEQIIDYIFQGFDILDKRFASYDHTTGNTTPTSDFYTSLHDTIRVIDNLKGATIKSYERPLIIDETNLVSYYPLDSAESGYGISAYVNYAGGVVAIPDSYNGKPITAINNGAIKVANATEVIIPDSITILGWGALRINSGDPFKLTFGANSELKTIDANAFQQNVFSNEIVFPETVNGIGSLAFGNVVAPKMIFKNVWLNKDAFKDAKIDELIFLSVPRGTAFADGDLGTFTGKVTIGTDTTTYVNGVAQP